MRDDSAILPFRSPEPTLETFERFLAGEGTADEVAQVRAWAGGAGVTGASHADDISVAIAMYAGNATSDVTRMQQALRERIGAVEIPGRKSLSPFGRSAAGEGLGQALGKRFGRSGSQTLRASLGLFGTMAALVMIFFVFRYRSQPMHEKVRRYTTGVNQQGIVTLSDGTRITLAPQTTVGLIEFSVQARTVFVDGKAYFEVAHAEGASFEVRGGSVRARVLGTDFLVDHAPHSSHVRVAVEEGKVRVFDADRAGADVIVTTGYIGEFTDSSQSVTAVNDSLGETEWFRGRLVFHHAPVATVLQTLTRWYGYQFQYTDSTLLQRNVTVGISVRSPALALATLEQVLRVNLTVRGDTITLAPQVKGRKENMSRIRSYDVWTPIREVGR